MAILDLDRLCAAPLHRDPFDFVIVEQFVAPSRCPALIADFPRLPGHGSYPLDLAGCGPAFAGLADELTGDGLRRAIEDKFDIDLAGRPTMITVRGRSGPRDGYIHTDSPTKLITVLIYLNPGWNDEAGRLRLLRGPDDLGDYAAEIPPLAGAMVAFRRSAKSFHGERRVIQLNWVSSRWVLFRETVRHRFSAWVKRLLPRRPARAA